MYQKYPIFPSFTPRCLTNFAVKRQYGGVLVSKITFTNRQTQRHIITFQTKKTKKQKSSLNRSGENRLNVSL